MDEAEGELEVLLSLDGASYEAAQGFVVEFTVRRTERTAERPHGISYALVLRPKDGGSPWVRFDNAHAPQKKSRGYKRRPEAYDHWHRTASDTGSPYEFTTAVQLLEDFWRAVKGALDEEGIEHGL